MMVEFRHRPAMVAGMSLIPSLFRRKCRISASPNCSSRFVGSVEAGLTLIEMIIVLAIIALIAGLIVPNVIGRPDEARVTVAGADLRTISAALKMYRLDNSNYPSTDQGLEALAERPRKAPLPRTWPQDGYLAEIPRDPWDRPYVYRSPGANGGFDLVSLGRDGRPGGEGVDADISAQRR